MALWEAAIPVGSAGETTVNYRYSPAGRSTFSQNLRLSPTQSADHDLKQVEKLAFILAMKSVLQH